MKEAFSMKEIISTTGAPGAGFVPGLIAVCAFAAVLVWLVKRTDRTLAAEYALSGAK